MEEWWGSERCVVEGKARLAFDESLKVVITDVVVKDKTLGWV